MKSKKNAPSKRETRNLRMQQLMFVALGVIVILSMVIGMIAK
ncbi:MAG: hypothetical protein ACKOC5_02755 [Chloroflexota bacterium]